LYNNSCCWLDTATNSQALFIYIRGGGSPESNRRLLVYPLTVDQKMNMFTKINLVEYALTNRDACTVATTNQQPKPTAEPKTAVSAKSYRR
jgi:hypothetical protein